MERLLAAMSTAQRLLVITIVSVGMTLFILLFLPISIGEWAILVSLFIFITILAYEVAFRRLAERRWLPPEDWRWQVEPRRSGISNRAFNRLRHVLADAKHGERENEDQVFFVTRYHGIYLFLKMWWMIPVTALVFSLPAWVPTEISLRNAAEYVTTSPPTTATTGDSTIPPISVVPPLELPPLPEKVHLPWWLFAGLDLVVIAVLVLVSIDWIYSFVMLTNKNLFLIKMPPIWLPWMRAPIHSLPVRRVGKVNNEDSYLGNILGYGAVQIGTNMQEDAEFNRIPLVPDHMEVMRDLEYVVPTGVVA